ncbi:MAG TPA: VWA domain-containing protein [Terriglobales bacterium]|nr:VWA domain-containing protein [Terriglobales bacterium]
MGWKFMAVLLLGILVPSQWAQSIDSSNDVGGKQVQPDNQGSDEEIPTIRASVQEVNVIFTATDKKGRFKRNLTPEDLAVYDDGKPPAALRSFRSETDLPLRVGLVFDVSGSITERFTFEQESAINFFNRVLRPHTDKAFVLAFDSTPSLTQDFTDNTALLAAGVKKFSPSGGSAVYDALQVAAAKKLMNVRADRPVRRIIVLISDGEDNQSRATIPQVIDAARRAEVTIYAISTNNSPTVSRGDKLLRKLAEETGGRAFFPNKIDDVTKAFETIQDELRSQYALSYKPADFTADGRYRSINIQARSDKNLIIRARKGYFAPAQ